MKYILTLFLFILVVGISCKKKQSPLTEEEVIAVVKRFDDGWKGKNFSIVDSVLAPSYIYFTQSGSTFNRKNLVETAGSSEYLLESAERIEYKIKLFENTAVVSTRWIGKGIYKGVNFDENQRCSIAIIKIDSKVQILSEHCTPIKSLNLLH
jgi:hypothetical protein